MQDIKYKTYTKKRMLKIIETEGFAFVDNNFGDHFIIRIKDIPDFIILETIRMGHQVKLDMYIPGIDEPVLTTMGWFLNKTNPLLREEIINKLIVLQTTDTKPKNVKIFDNDIFVALSTKENGIENGQVKNFEKFYRKYIYAQNIHNIKMGGI